MSRAEHLIENALISVTHQEDIESYIAGEISKLKRYSEIFEEE